jgi:DNA-binding LacI/PurR family transcriptional regulator
MKHMGELGAQKLIAQIEGTTDARARPELIRLQPDLVERRTVAPPPINEAMSA